MSLIDAAGPREAPRYEEAPAYPTGKVLRPASPLLNPAMVAPYGSVIGRKDDSGKLDMTLFDDMPRALAAVCEVMQWAVTKKEPTPYTRGSWLGVEPDRYRAAIRRHDLAATKQASEPSPQPAGYKHGARFERDDETHLLHLAHMACSALFALELTMREMEKS